MAGFFSSKEYGMSDRTAATAIGPEVSNGAALEVSFLQPYAVEVTVQGVADFLYHRWNNEAVAEKAKAAKGSKAKKTDNIQSYVWRVDETNPESELAIPGEYVRQAIIHAAKFRQDPRSPRKSAMDLFKAGVVSLTQAASVGKVNWDYEHACRVTVQRNSVTRVRPALKSGWRATFVFQVNLPEYISVELLQDVLTQAGRIIGVGDFRPSYGRFMVTEFKPTT
jgi:hypothetical protein